MGRITVLDPTAAPPPTQPDPGPAVGRLHGRTVGIRNDRTWRSFDWIAEEWAARLRAAGAEVELWTSGSRIGEEGRQTEKELARFVADVDLAVVGLGN